MIKKLVFTAVIIGSLLYVSKLQAQEVHGKPDVWFMLMPQYQINESWAVGTELHMRYDDYLNDEEQLLIRPYLNYNTKKTPNVVYTLGYTFVRTHPYGEYPIPDIKPEHNVWEQITFKQKIGKVAISHRYRLEERWQGDLVANTKGGYDVDGYTYGNRFRYRLTVTRPLVGKYFVNGFNELWLKTNKSFKAMQYDRNWLYIALGRHMTEHIDLQVAYMNQYIMNSSDLYERHHTIQITGNINL